MAIEERIVRGFIGHEPKFGTVRIRYSSQIPFTLDDQPMQAGFGGSEPSADDRDVRQHKTSGPVIGRSNSAFLVMRFSVHRLQSRQQLLVTACIGWT